MNTVFVIAETLPFFKSGAFAEDFGKLIGDPAADGVFFLGRIKDIAFGSHPAPDIANQKLRIALDGDAGDIENIIPHFKI